MSSSTQFQHFCHPTMKSSQSDSQSKKKNLFAAMCTLKQGTKDCCLSCQDECCWSNRKIQSRIGLGGYNKTGRSFNSWLITFPLQISAVTVLCQRLIEANTLQYPDWTGSIMIYAELRRNQICGTFVNHSVWEQDWDGVGGSPRTTQCGHIRDASLSEPAEAHIPSLLKQLSSCGFLLLMNSIKRLKTVTQSRSI